MSYFFPYWGPLVFKTRIAEPDRRWISRSTKKKYHIQSAKDKLAGVIDEEFKISQVDLMKDLTPYFDLYRQAHYQYYQEDNQWIDKIQCVTAWINIMKAGEYNPTHFHHDCRLSSVLYLKVPKELKKENADYVGRSVGPGGITFLYGEPRGYSITQYSLFPQEGDLLIFPANVRHEVTPFKSKGKRISIAANFE